MEPEPINEYSTPQPHNPTTVSGKKRLLILLIGWAGVILLVVAYRDQSYFILAGFLVQGPRLDPVLYFNTTDGDDGCMGFTDEPLVPSIEKYFWKQPRIKCEGPPSFLYVTDGGEFLKLDKEKIRSLGELVDYCKYSSLRRADKDGDFNIVASAWSKSFTNSISLPEDVDHVWGRCYYGTRLVGSTYASIIRKKGSLEQFLEKRYQSHMNNNKPKETLSVLLMGIDGTSKLNFARHMRKTKSFLLNMRGIEMHKVNKVGQNTIPNIMPLLTGYSMKEMRTNWTDNQYFDELDNKFLWEDFKNAGYRTSLLLDQTHITSFHYLKKGWNKPTVHYNNRPLVVQSEADKQVRRHNPYCIGDQSEISLYYDYWLQLARTFNNTKKTPYFGYSFFAHATHNELNAASSVDDIYLEVFQKLVRQKCLNNTIIVFFSDHGSRYGDFRSTFRGMLEDNNPFMVFIFPPWFESKYPKIMANFRQNQHRVMTSFDVYATLKDVLNFQGDDIADRPSPKNKTRGISLFQKLPDRRSCEEAEIPLIYCNCRNFSSEGITAKLTEQVSKTFLKAVNAETKLWRSECVTLTLKSTISIMPIFNHASLFNVYQATIRTTPGGAVFEATLKQEKKSRASIVLEGEITRINMYRGQADCISDARIRPFCYCRNLLE